LGNKDKDFWNNLKWWEVIIMSETWVEKSGWERIRKLQKGYVWGVQGGKEE